MSWANNDILVKCEALAHAGYNPTFKIGMLVGRGFADVGSEVFTVHPGNKLLSLFTGKLTEITAAEQQKLFHVPSVDELLEVLAEKEVRVSKLLPNGSAEWSADIVFSKSDDIKQYSAKSVIELLIQVLSDVYK